MHIVHIASELAPIAKVGGLADVVYGLSRQLVALGHTVEVILPKYATVTSPLHLEHKEVLVEESGHKRTNTVWSLELDGLKVLLIEDHHPKRYFNRDKIYGFPDDIDRFTYFCKAALEVLFLRDTLTLPDVLHLHDWPTALVAVLCQELYRVPNRAPPKTLLTLHNMQHQGLCSVNHLTRLGLGKAPSQINRRLRDPTNLHLMNLLQGGIEYADALSTVSPTYEKEIQTAEGGFGLEECVVENRAKLTGILNGIDEGFWNPATDPHLAKNYKTHGVDPNHVEQVASGKQGNKTQLRKQLYLQNTDAPLVACISRLVSQKSPDLIAYGLRRTLSQGGQFVLLGSSASPEILQEFQALKKEFRGNPNVALCLEHDEPLAHLIFAAADLFLIPSRFEPCGLTQLIALRYGTVPIARSTGGLKDTVFDKDTSERPLDQRNGFTFDFPDSKGVDWALDRALQCYRHAPDEWRLLLLNGMRQDFSWKHAAQEYITMYRKIKI